MQHGLSFGWIDCFDLIQMEYMPVARADVGELDETPICQACGIFPGDLNPAIAPGTNVLELGAENTGMQVIQTTVEAEAVHIALIGAMVAQFPDSVIEIRAVGADGPSIPKGAQVFVGDEAVADGVGELPGLESVSMGIDGLGIVFHDKQAIFIGDFSDLIQRGALPGQMNGHNRPGGGGAPLPTPPGFDAAGLWVTVDQ